METSTTHDIHRPHTVPEWWHKASIKTTQFLDVAAAFFAEHRRLVLGVMGGLMLLGLVGGSGSSSAGGGKTLGEGLAAAGAAAGGGEGGGDLPSSLRRLIQATRNRALSKGKLGLGGTSAYTPALQPLATIWEIVRDGHIDFIISEIKPEALKHKKASQALASSSPPSSLPSSSSSSSPKDPFGAGQREALLTVCDVGEGHILMLNKYPTMTDHLILVTKEWQPQQGLLRAEDLYAWHRLIHDVPAVGIFNSGPEAGASQGHRHLQAIPLDILRSYRPSLLPSPHPSHIVPINALIEPHLASLPPSSSTSSFHVPTLPFRHRLFLLPPSPTPHELEGLYHRLLKRIGVLAQGGGQEGGREGGRGLGDEDVQKAYNLVMTEKWLMAVPRSEGRYVGVDVNGMGFLGCLLSKDKETTGVIKRVRPFNVLKGVVAA